MNEKIYKLLKIFQPLDFNVRAKNSHKKLRLGTKRVSWLLVFSFNVKLQTTGIFNAYLIFNVYLISGLFNTWNIMLYIYIKYKKLQQIYDKTFYYVFYKGDTKKFWVIICFIYFLQVFFICNISSAKKMVLKKKHMDSY